MPFTNEIDLYEKFKFLFIGENGTGKSIAAASFFKHKKGRIKIEDVDGRMKPIKRAFPDTKIEYDTITPDSYRDFLDRCEKMQDDCPYDVWVFDSVTSLSATCIVWQLQSKGLMKAGGKTSKAGIPVTSWDEINAETAIFTKMLEIHCKEVNKKFGTTIIWIAHPVSKMDTSGKGEDGAALKYRSIAAYGNKIPSIIPGYFDEVYNFTLEKRQMNRYSTIVSTVPKADLQGKTALNMPDELDITEDFPMKKGFYEFFMEALKARQG